MKINSVAEKRKALPTGLILIGMLILSCAHAQQKALEFNKNDHLIDSLIVVKKINEKAILLLFGSEAITAIKTREGILVIDAGISKGLTLKFRHRIEKEFQSDDFVYVINTHCHPDHYGGNSVFYEAKIIGQENGLKEISEQRANPGKTKESIAKIVDEYELQLTECKINTEEWSDAFTQKIRYYNALIDAEMQVPVKYPDITFSDSLQLDMGDMKVEMLYFGKCHSNSDILIYVPELKILFSGDLFFKYGRPGINDKLLKDKEKWENAVLWLEKRTADINTIISGHGKILTINDLKNFSQCIKEKYLKSSE